EPFGMTLLEAMASGVPLVTTDCGGPPHILHEAGGRVVPMGDADRLARALVEIVSNVELQRSMGVYNRRRIEEEFDWSRSLDRMGSVYERVLSQQAGPPDRDTARGVGAGGVSLSARHWFRAHRPGRSRLSGGPTGRLWRSGRWPFPGLSSQY